MNAFSGTKASLDQAPNVTLVVFRKISQVLHRSQQSVNQGFLKLVEIGVLALRELRGENEVVIKGIVERQGFFVVALALPRGNRSHGGRHRC